MEKVLVTRLIPEAGLEILRGAAQVVLWQGGDKPGRADLLELGRGCRAMLTQLNDPIDRELLQSLPEVRMVANYAVGYDNIDLEAARELGVAVTNTPGVLTGATADLHMALVLAVMRRVVEGDADLRAGGFSGLSPLYMLGSDLGGKTMGIYGMGRIGRAVARRAAAFGMNIIYHNRRPNPEAEEALGARYVGFDELLAGSDVISINAPLNPATRAAFDLAALEKMKSGAYLVNTGRGPIVVEDDLATALERGLIAGAALDVYQDEPVVNPRLLGMKNVVLCPHLGSATWEVRSKMAEMAAGGIVEFLAGGEPDHRLV